MTPYIGQILLVGFNFAPVGWLMCDGSLQSIANYDVLFNLIGTTYGGDGQQTFALPDLRGRVPIHQGQGAGTSNYVVGQNGGVTSVTLNVNQIPSHNHGVACAAGNGSTGAPGSQYFASAASPVNLYNGSASPSGNMTNVIAPAGGSQAHDNMQPYLAINYIIATEGIYPSQS
jgi:microcystin-dependent protein